MKARYQYRFYPTDQQRRSLAQLFGCVRVVWNDALAFCKALEKFPGYSKLSSELTQVNKTEPRHWLKDVSSVPLQQSLRHLDSAYRHFFNTRNGKHKGKKMGLPRFKKKTGDQSAEFTKAAFSVTGNTLYLAKIGNLNPVWSRALPSEPSSVTVIRDCANRYFLSFVVEVEAVSLPASNPSVGIDLGLKTFAVLSTGEEHNSPDYSKLDRRVRKLQRKLARQGRCPNDPQQKGSRRRSVTKLRIARQHNRIADTRKDFLHKLSTRIVRENQAIVLEDLNVSGMLKNRKLARAISLAGWREFRVLCEGKAEQYGRQFTVISRWEPTSQVCSSCGFKWGKLDLSVRAVRCLSCGVDHDRDINAARNIEKVGMGHRHDSKRTQREGQTTSVAHPVEASRITVA